MAFTDTPYFVSLSGQPSFWLRVGQVWRSNPQYDDRKSPHQPPFSDYLVAGISHEGGAVRFLRPTGVLGIETSEVFVAIERLWGWFSPVRVEWIIELTYETTGRVAYYRGLSSRVQADRQQEAHVFLHLVDAQKAVELIRQDQGGFTNRDNPVSAKILLI